jgi:hypothetical protein
MADDVATFRAEMLARLPELAPDDVTVELVGPSVGPHLGPGCIGVVALYRPS